MNTEPTPAAIAIVRDLTNKASADIARVLKTTVSLVGEAGGVGAMLAMEISLAAQFVAAVAHGNRVARQRPDPKHDYDLDDLIYAALIVAAHQAHSRNLLPREAGLDNARLVAEWFKAIRGRPYPYPLVT
jgi:hypothetical protein